jgi:hypothetical protein
MARLDWYWHRLRAMTPTEVALHGRKKIRQLSDARRTWRPMTVGPASSGAFPRLPCREASPVALTAALRADATDILAGRWGAFGDLRLAVDDPPRWQEDYLVGADLATTASAFKLDHRALPAGADVKLIWELSRWNQLVRLAMASYVLEDARARHKCIQWLQDWVARNPPYRGWNWTSALEAGIRLVQVAWIDALLPDAGEVLARLRDAVLPPHVAFAWRHRSFGSSANNHLLGELAGCIVAVARWPRLAGMAAPLEELQRCWEREVLAQFAEDGGNREQALNYHLFAFELCLQTRLALEAAGREPSPAVHARLALAADFFVGVQAAGERWDYGDSDDAYVTPVFASDPVGEWREWIQRPDKVEAIGYWMGSAPAAEATGNGSLEVTNDVGGWSVYPRSGIAVRVDGPWRLRWDVSPLGYLSTAAHGHLDALHLSIWIGEHAVVIDPGTGAYFGDLRLREWLASRGAHNAPCPIGKEHPERLGPFLWDSDHPAPALRTEGAAVVAALELPGVRLRRRVGQTQDGAGWIVEDACIDSAGHGVPFTTRWQFAPACEVRQLSDRAFSVTRDRTEMTIHVGREWNTVQLVAVDPGSKQGSTTSGGSLEGIVSPAFRQVRRAPFLKLTASPGKGESPAFGTTFSGLVRA